MTKVALTGAAGGMGKILREELLKKGMNLRSSARKQLQPLIKAEDIRCGDLSDSEVVDHILKDVDVLIHLAGTSVEKPLEEIIQNNLRSLVAVYEGARRQNVKRIIFASSNHAIGMYSSNEPKRLSLDCEFRPDSFYGLSKMWGEGIASMYWHKHGIESICIRIGSCEVEPSNVRHLSTWLGHQDFFHLIDRCINADAVGYMVVWGVSKNSRSYWDNAQAKKLGYLPQQDAENYVQKIVSKENILDPIARQYQGGSFVSLDYTHPDQRRTRMSIS